MITLHHDAFFDYVEEREQIRLRKEADLAELRDGGIPQGPPWTDNPILRDYKFTNVHRHHDRTSAFFRDNFYTEHFEAPREEILMNCAVFRYFGSMEFAEAIGWVGIDDLTEEYWERVKETARERSSRGERVFTGAYVISNSGIAAPKYEVVVDYFLKGLFEASESIVATADATRSWKAVISDMSSLMGFAGSGFMSKEVILDTTYTGFWRDGVSDEMDGLFSYPDDWWSWTPIGPGARRGAYRVAGRFDEMPQRPSEKLPRMVIDELFKLQGKRAWEVSMRRLSPHDIQFALCEFDKYERQRLGQGRIKTRYDSSKFLSLS